MKEIRCRGVDRGAACNRFLGEVDGAVIRIYCPKCQARHEIPITELIADLQGYLAELQAKVEANGGGKGFML